MRAWLVLGFVGAVLVAVAVAPGCFRIVERDPARCNDEVNECGAGLFCFMGQCLPPDALPADFKPEDIARVVIRNIAPASWGNNAWVYVQPTPAAAASPGPHVRAARGRRGGDPGRGRRGRRRGRRGRRCGLDEVADQPVGQHRFAHRLRMAATADRHEVAAEARFDAPDQTLKREEKAMEKLENVLFAGL